MTISFVPRSYPLKCGIEGLVLKFTSVSFRWLPHMGEAVSYTSHTHTLFDLQYGTTKKGCRSKKLDKDSIAIDYPRCVCAKRVTVVVLRVCVCVSVTILSATNLVYESKLRCYKVPCYVPNACIDNVWISLKTLCSPVICWCMLGFLTFPQAIHNDNVPFIRKVMALTDTPL
jgi:hypothetical protein